MIKKKDLKLRIILILGIVIFSIYYVFWPNWKENINLGLDLKGGMYILLRADTKSIPPSKISEAVNGAIEKIRNRIDSYGVKETSIQTQGSNAILVQIPGIVDKDIVRKLKEVGRLEFKLVEDDEEKIKKAQQGETEEKYELKKYRENPILLYKKPSLTGKDLVESFVGFDSYGVPLVRLKFTSSGKKKFAKVTQKNVGKRLAILIDEKVISAPQIREPILNGEAEITGDFSLDEARMLSAVLNSGALPVPLIVEEERSVGPLLGSDAIRRGINSIVLGAILVIVFMLVYYLWGGIISIFCLFLDLLFILAGLRLFGATLTLPGIAGMILTLGMAVDANVLIFERIREELSLNHPFSLAIKNGFDKAKRTIFDANITTLIAAFFLFVYGTGPIRGFATTLSLGILASIFTAVYVGRTIFSFFILKFKKFPMLKILPNFSMDFVKWKNLCLLLSFIIIVAGITNFYLKKEKVYGIDFKGGQILEYKVTPPVKIEKMRDILRENNLRDLSIQEFKDIKGAISIKSKKDVAQDVERVLNKNFKEVKILKRTTIGPAIGKILKKKAFFSILFSLLGILIYIGFRFKHFDFAFAAVIALFHDVLISLGLLSFSDYELSLLVITALLTIAGYSINDTIVVYDRIREIGPRFPKLSLREVVNQAINNTLSRTIITSLTTILVVISIFLYGGESLKGFSFTLLVGFIAGTYSSIYIASPLVLFFRKSSR